MIANSRRIIVPAMMLLSTFLLSPARALGADPIATEAKAGIDHDLFEVSIPQLEQFYRDHKYTVTQVAKWYIARIHRYNGIYGAIEFLNEKDALETAARMDREAAAGG